MKKKGQFYILAAVILSIVIFGITVTVNKIEQEVETTDFVELAQNYVLETPELINYAIYWGIEDTPGLLSDFTKDFIDYAHKKNPKLGLLYIYKEGDKTIIENYLQEGEAIEYEIEGEEEGEIFEFGDITLNEIALEIGEEEFTYTVPTKLKHFGDLHGADLEATKWVKLKIGGIPYVFNIGEEDIDFQVIIKGKPNEETEVICIKKTKPSGKEILSCRKRGKE